MAETPKAPVDKDEVIKQFPSIGKHRIRLIKNRRPKGVPSLDIREFVKSDTFEGFTRRGIRLSDAKQIDELIKVLQEAKEMDAWPKA